MSRSSPVQTFSFATVERQTSSTVEVNSSGNFSKEHNVCIHNGHV